MDGNVSFQVFAAKWLERKSRSFKPQTVSNIKALVAHVPDVKIKDINLWTLEDLQESLKPALSPARNNKVLMVVRQILEDAVALNIIEKNPAERLKLLSERAPEIKPFLLEELELIIMHLPEFWQPLFITMTYTGCRQGELFALRWEDINFDQGLINISKSRSVDGSESSPKTRASVRTIPMMPQVRAALLEQYQAGLSSEYVFVDKKSKKPLNQRGYLSRMWKEACQKAGLEPRRAYEIRHSFGSNALLKGVNLPVVAKTMGHSSVQTTIKRYVRPIASSEQMAEELGRAFA